LHVADVDGDEHPDPLVFGGSRAIWVAIGDGEPVSHPLEIPALAGMGGDHVFADVTGDGAADHVSVTLHGCGDCPDYTTLEVARGDGQGGFAEATVARLCGSSTELRVVDLGGDPTPEIVTETGCIGEPSVLTVFDGLSLAERVRLDRTLELATGSDVDGDGVIDLVGIEQGASDPPQLVVLRGEDGFEFSPAWQQPLLPGAFAGDLQSIDLDGDRFGDLVVVLATQDQQRSFIATFRGGAAGPEPVAVGPEALPFVALNVFVTETIVGDADGDCREQALLFVPAAPVQNGTRLLQYDPLSGQSRPRLQPDPVDLRQLAGVGARAPEFPALFGLTAEDEIVQLLPSTCGPPEGR
jgi:hypothetical protein